MTTEKRASPSMRGKTLSEFFRAEHADLIGDFDEATARLAQWKETLRDRVD